MVMQGTGNREQGTVAAAMRWLVALSACLLATGPAEARRSDREQPIAIDAEHMEGVLTDNGEAILRGNVRIDQGTLAIRAATATVTMREGEIVQVVLDGAPATMVQEGEDGAPTRASARRIEYDVSGEQVALVGGAAVEQPRGTLTGERLTYDLASERVAGGGEGGRVHMVIQPKRQADGTDE
jgi:lipopolysaccharide export system protein LptA